MFQNKRFHPLFSEIYLSKSFFPLFSYLFFVKIYFFPFLLVLEKMEKKWFGLFLKRQEFICKRHLIKNLKVFFWVEFITPKIKKTNNLSKIHFDKIISKICSLIFFLLSTNKQKNFHSHWSSFSSIIYSSYNKFLWKIIEILLNDSFKKPS